MGQPKAASLGPDGSAAIDDDRHDGLDRLIEGGFRHRLAIEKYTDFRGEVRVILGRAPDDEEQIERINPAGCGPS